MPRLLLAILMFAGASGAKADLIAPFTLNLSQLGGSASVSGLTIDSGLNFEDGLATTDERVDRIQAKTWLRA